MKMNAKLLKKVLVMAKRIAVAKAAYPILSNVKIMQATGGEITLTATDLDVWVHYALGTMKAESQPVLLHVDPRKLYKLLTACKISNGDTVELVAEENNGMVVEIGKRTFRLPTVDPNDWPAQPVLSGEVTTVQVDDAEPLRYTARAISTDTTRYNMCGVYFDSDCLVATNTHILIRVEHPIVSEKPMIVPTVVVRALLDTKPKSYAVSAFSQHTVFETPDGHKIVGRNSEGKFPNYKQVIPTDTATASISGPSKNWTETMKTVGAVVEGRVKGFKFSITPKEPLVFESNDEEGVEYSEDIKWAAVTGEMKHVGFNTEYVLMCLQGETATLSMTGPNDPARLTSERDGYLAIIMPMRV